MASISSWVWVWLSGFAFALLHSGMASPRLKAWLMRHAGLTMTRYRLIYSIIALVATVIWLLFVHALPDRLVYHVQGWPVFMLLAVQIVGLGVVLLSFRAFDVRIFLGLAAMPEGGEPFHEHGIYRCMRHPMYSGVMLALLASPMQSVNSLHLTLFICMYFVLGARLEERRMIAAHPAYVDYRRRVPAFVPRLGCSR